MFARVPWFAVPTMRERRSEELRVKSEELRVKSEERRSEELRVKSEE